MPTFNLDTLTSGLPDLVIVIGGVAAILVVIHLILAARHDHEVAAAPKYLTLEALDQKIELKRGLVADHENELDRVRKALASVADLRAEADALERKRDDLLVEWNQLGDRRTEVHEMRKETESALNEKLSVESSLATLREEHERVRERVEKAERLLEGIERAEGRKAELEAAVSALQEEAQRLRDAERRLKELAETEERLRRRIQEAEMHAVEAKQEAEAASARTAEMRAEHNETAARLEGLRQGVNGLEKTRASLEAQVAHLKKETAGDDDTDQLEELRAVPAVLEDMMGWPSSGIDDERSALDAVQHRLLQSGLTYDPRKVLAFHTAMKVNDTTQMTVLAGISGTGKTQLPRHYALGMGIGFLQVPVQPRWDSPQDLMGFYNYIERRFRPTDMARALYHLDTVHNSGGEFGDRMLLVLLDEMNLARVEYYFSDFLSRLENRPPRGQVHDDSLRKDAEIELEIPVSPPPRIFPGYNLLFAGTMNEDESTQSLSDKVVDRANVLRFAAPGELHPATDADESGKPPRALSRKAWESWLRPPSDAGDDTEVKECLDHMAKLMKGFRRPFGHRLARAIMAYVANYPEGPGGNPRLDALADQVEMRLLPKLRGVETGTTEHGFKDLKDFVEKRLKDDALAKAIEHSLEVAGDNGQFVWTGVTRP